MENLKIDENSRWVLGAVSNDGSGDIKNVRVNPITGAIIVEANITSTNTSIGSTIPGGTAGSVLFLGAGGTLAQDNANLFYDDTNNFLGIGTNTPSVELDVQGSAIITGSTGTPTDLLGRDGSGNISNIVLGSNLTLTGGVLSANTSGATGYDQIQDNGTNVTQRTTLNFVNYFTVTDASSKTNVSINTSELGADATLISTLETNLDLANISGQIDLTTQVTGQLSATNIDITNLESTLDLANIAGQIDLTTQVTGQLPPANIDVSALASDTTFITALEPNLDLANLGGDLDLTSQVGTSILPLANGGTGSNLSDPGANKLLGWDDTDNSVGFWTLGSGLSYDHGTHTISASGALYTVNADETVATWFTDTVELPISGATLNGWTVSNISAITHRAFGTFFGTFNSGVCEQIFSEATVSNTFRFNTGKDVRVKIRASVEPGGTNGDAIAFGFADSGTTNFPDPTSVDRAIKFVWKNVSGVDTLYTVTADNSANTNNSFTGYVFNDSHIYEYVWTATDVKFYIDGTLLATHTTNIPASSDTVYLKFVNNSTTSQIFLNKPTISIKQ